MPELHSDDVRPRRILFVCNMNSIRSPIAAAIARDLLGGEDTMIDSAGVHAGEIDFFVEEVLEDIGLKLTSHHPKALSSCDIEAFDAIVALTPAAMRAATEMGGGGKAEYWKIANPTDVRGGRREQILAAYRASRDEIYARIRDRFCGK